MYESFVFLFSALAIQKRPRLVHLSTVFSLLSTTAFFIAVIALGNKNESNESAPLSDVG